MKGMLTAQLSFLKHCKIERECIFVAINKSQNAIAALRTDIRYLLSCHSQHKLVFEIMRYSSMLLLYFPQK